MAVRRGGTVSSGYQLGAAVCFLVFAVSAATDYYYDPQVPLQSLYLLILVAAAVFASRWIVLALAAACLIIGPLHGNLRNPELTQRTWFELLTLAGVALLASHLAHGRSKTVDVLRKARGEARLNADAVLQMRAALDVSPIGLLTVDSKGKIGMVNSSACRLLGFSTGSPEGHSVDEYFPALATLRQSKQVTDLTQRMIEVAGRRKNGESFLSQACVSHYQDASGLCLALCLAAILSDVTELVRDREEAGLKQLLSNSRIIAGAVSHELRNLAAAASVLRLNLARVQGLNGNIDFQALETVIDSMLRISSTELSDANEGVLEGLDVIDLLLELRTIISPELRDAGIKAEWEIPDSLPPVRAERSGLLQVLLNLTKNSRRALQDIPAPSIRVAAYALDQSVVIRVADNGPGIPSVERLFQPFQPGASSTGLGLFVSRAIIRTFGGELHHTRPAGECAFVIDLPAMQVEN